MANSDVLVRMKADTQGYDANIAKARRQLDQFKKDNLSMGGVLKQLNSNLLATAARFASVTAAVGALGAAFKSNIETAKNFEKSMSQLSSLTGMVGDDLGKLKEYAIELGASTTLSASQVADAFKMIGSQQPQLLASGEALKSVTKNAITLAEAAGIELADAAKTLSVSINQMGGDSSNAERYINVLAAAAQKGAGDIVWLGEAITKSGTTAKAVGTDYEELVSNLEQLAKAGYDASTAGTALRSIIMNLEKQANQQYKPSVVGLTQAFKNLGDAHLTLTEYQNIAGKMFAAQAKALADAAGEAENMRVAITGTNIAEEQAKTNTDNLDGALKSLASAWEGLNLHINSSNGLLRDTVDWLKDVVVWADEAYLALEKYYKGPNKEDVVTSGMSEVGSNVDDKGNYIKRPANGNWAGFDAEKGTWKEGYWGAIYNSQTGQTELPDIVVNGQNKTNPTTPTKTTKSGKTQNLPEYLDFYKQVFKNQGDSLKNEIEHISPFDMFKDQAQFDPENILGSKDAWEDYKDTVAGAIGGIGDSFSNLTEWTKDFDPYEEKMKELSKTAMQNQMAMSMAGQAANSFASALASIDDPAARAAGTVISAIANIALGFGMAVAQAGKMGPWAWLAYVAAGTAALATTISTVHSLTGYAEGGIVKGNSYSGDNVYAGNAWVNSGELVLNKAQQNSLANTLSGNGMNNINLRATLQGEQILLAVDRTLKRQGKGELATFK